MFSLMCVWTNGWANSRYAGHFGHHGAHYCVIVMLWWRMMTSQHGNYFHINGPLWGETPVDPFTNGRLCRVLIFYCVVSQSRLLKKPLICWWLETVIWSHNSVLHGSYNGPIQWRHNESNGVSNHRRPDCLFNRLFRHRSKKTPKLRVTGLC